MKLIILALLVFILSCTNSNETTLNTSQFDTTVTATTPALSRQEDTVSLWNYSENIDKMDGSITKLAEIESTNTIDFHFPYDGGSQFFLTIRKRNRSSELLLSVDKGQFLDNNNSRARIKFDDEKPFFANYDEPSDGSSNVIFIQGANTLINKIKKAKTVTIECEFFEEGRKQIDFTVHGLNWD